MEATLKFNLPDEQYEFDLAIRAGDMHSAITAIRELLRQKHKYGHNYKSANKAVAGIYDEVNHILSEYPDI